MQPFNKDMIPNPEWFRMERLRRHMKQREASKALGSSHTLLSAFEAGRKPVSVEFAIRYAALLGHKIDLNKVEK